jgi:hypothetical protein
VRLVTNHPLENGKDVEPGQREWGGGDGSALRSRRNILLFLGGISVDRKKK